MAIIHEGQTVKWIKTAKVCTSEGKRFLIVNVW